MASITISGGGSIPSKSKGFSSDGTPEGHAALFAEVRDFVDAWEREAKAQDEAQAAPASAEEAAEQS